MLVVYVVCITSKCRYRGSLPTFEHMYHQFDLFIIVDRNMFTSVCFLQSITYFLCSLLYTAKFLFVMVSEIFTTGVEQYSIVGKINEPILFCGYPLYVSCS